MFLSILAVSSLLIASAGCSSVKVKGHVVPPCCDNGTDGVPGTIMECFEQKPRPSCPGHFYLVDTVKGMYCINPNSGWLKWIMKKRNLKCPPPQIL